MSTINVKGLNVIAVYVSDLERAKNFYSNELGFVQTQELPPGLLLSAGDITIYLEAGRSAKNDILKVTEFSPCFETESVKGSYEALKESGVKIISGYEEYGPEFALFRIADPDGNLIEFAGKP